MSRVFRALSDPTRRAVLAQLVHKSASMTELARPFKMALPSFAHTSPCWKNVAWCGHIKKAGCGATQLIPQPLAGAEDWMMAQRAIWEQRLDQLGEYVEKMQSEER